MLLPGDNLCNDDTPNMVKGSITLCLFFFFCNLMIVLNADRDLSANKPIAAYNICVIINQMGSTGPKVSAQMCVMQQAVEFEIRL